jgi:PAS domain-containing protein
MSWIKGKLNKKIIWLRIDLPAFLAFVFFAGLIFIYLIPGFERVMMDRKRTMLQEISSSGYSLLEHYYSLERKGKLSRTEAQELACSSIGSIRFGTDKKDYFWITNMKPEMIEHPYRKDLNGKDLTGFQDSRGKYIFVEFVNAIASTGESYVDYMWQWNDDSTRIVPKLSYVRHFKPWGWIIGTGIYIEDVKSEIRKIEKRALFISGIIALAIIILLSVITRQSHIIEQKRRKTEENLIRSKELYQTLAEAATEGVLIWSANGIQANKILLSWIGYKEDELMNRKLAEVFSSPDADDASDPERFYDLLLNRRYGECQLIARDGNIIKAHSDFSRLILGDKKAVMALIKPVKHTLTGMTFSPSADLMNSVSAGFFRISFGKKNRFLMATRPALGILGYDNIMELTSVPVESFFASPDQFRILKKRIGTKEPALNMVLELKNRSGVHFHALVSVLVVEQNYPELWCEGSIEYLKPSENEELRIDPVPPRYYSSFIMETPVNVIMKKPEEYPPETPLNNVGLDRSIAFAYEIMLSTGERSLSVIRDDGTTAGFITERDIIDSLSSQSNVIAETICKAAGTDDLRKAFLRMQNIAISMIFGKADPVTVTSFISGVADLICERSVHLCIEAAGPPPCRFAFIQTGSAGRKEQTLFTDQDNAIIFEDTTEKLLPAARKYFMNLGRMVNEMLAETGYNLCKGNNMAGNSEWCQPLSVWKRYFSDWIRIPDPQNLLEISIFFDFRHCYGELSLTDNLRNYIGSSLITSDIFFHHMTSAWKNFDPKARTLEYESTDVKRIMMPLTGITRLYALKNGITSYSTTARIITLYERNHFSVSLLRDSIRAWRDLSDLRLLHQALSILEGREPDNNIDLTLAGAGTISSANMAVKAVSNLILMACNDFYATDI